jgi:serine/threonine protein kinase
MPVRLVSQEELPGPLQGYRLIERLGRGGFGEVWKVEAPGGLLKAAKFVFGDLDALDDESRPAEQELKALRRVREIRHPYILSLERFDTIDGQLIIVMELADRNLWDRFRDCRAQGLPGIPRDELLRYMEETAEALDLMNGHYQIQHLDIKPQNLFLVFNHVKVGDFGLAKLLDGMRATVTGGVTPVYAAPETFEGWVSRFSDQYSLAIVFQELLTGTRPFNGANTRQLLMQHINGVPDLSSLPEADRPIIGRALAKKPDDRWPTCAALVRELKLASVAQPPSPPASLSFVPPAPGASYSPPPAAGHPPTSPGPSTMPAGTGSGLPDSICSTRMAGSGAGRSVPMLTPHKAQTPSPVDLPPLVKPGGSHPGTTTGTPVPSGSLSARLVTPAAVASQPNPAQTLQRPLIVQTGRMSSLGIAPPEKGGEGVLVPALVIGVGQTGRRVLEAFKHLIVTRHGSLEKLPHLRLLGIDTDPEAVPASPLDHPGALDPRELIVARLQRPAHYLQRESLPPVDQWMPPRLLYTLSRTPGSANGVRAFGRLALFDNYRLIAQRVRQEIETFLTDSPLAEADKHTQLGLRSNRPRVYIVASLGGGTGSGMFLDLAFLLRHEFRQVGYLRPEVTGLFFVPPVDKAAARSVAVGNTYAALTELHCYQARLDRYQTAFDRSEAPVVDSDAPFSRVAILPLPRSVKPADQALVGLLAGRALFNELLTPAGRVIDTARTNQRAAVPVAAPTCQTFGLYRLSWPRPEMLAAATRRFAQRQIQRWTAKEAAHLREPIATWLAEQWTRGQLHLEAMVEALHGAVRESLREEPDRVFDAFTDPLRTRTPAGGKLDAAGASVVFDQILKVVGKPDCENDSQPGTIQAPLSACYEQLVKEAEGHVALMVATFIEVPQYRLPAAEEVVRQLADKLKHQVDVLEPVRSDLDKEVRALFSRLFQAIGSLGASSGFSVRRSSLTVEIVELMRVYPRKRLQLHVLDRVLSIYRRLLGNAPEYLREIGFCRSTLADLHAALTQLAPVDTAAAGPGKLILPDGCKNLDDAADQFLAGLAPEDLLSFEQRLQKETSKKFRGLGSVCLKPTEKLAAFRELLLTRSREFLDGQLDRSDPATIFFRYRSADGSAEPLLGEAFDEAAPELAALAGEPRTELAVLGVPPGPAGEQLQALAAQTLPHAQLIAAPLPDDICFYREYPLVPLTALPQLGDTARDAYQQMLSSDQCPHARVDVAWPVPSLSRLAPR